MIVTIFSGVTCLIVGFLMLKVLRVGFAQKPHVLRMFQLGFFVALFTLGVLQLSTFYFSLEGIPVPFYFPVTYSVADIVFAFLGVLYYLYYIKHPPLTFKR